MGKKNENIKWDTTHNVLMVQGKGQPKEDKLGNQQQADDLTKHSTKCAGSIALC